MEYQEYLSQKREIYDDVIQFIENENSNNIIRKTQNSRKFGRIGFIFSFDNLYIE